MKYITRELRGTYLYIRKQSIFEIIKCIVLFAMAFGIFFIGYSTLGTKKSLFSVFAVLALLPASKALVGVIMFLRYRSVSADMYERINSAVGNLPVLYENILTTSEKSYYVQAIVYVKGNLVALMAESKNSPEKITAHLKNVLKNAGHKEVNIKIYCNEKEFLSRCSEMKNHFADSISSGIYDAIFNTIKAVSL